MEESQQATHLISWMSARARGSFEASFDKALTEEDKQDLRKKARRASQETMFIPGSDVWKLILTFPEAERDSLKERVLAYHNYIDNVFSISAHKLP